jgi:hypothetical protein
MTRLEWYGKLSSPGRSFPGGICHLAALALLLLLAVPSTVSARVFRVFGPDNFVRTTAAPATEERRFKVQYPADARFNLHVFYVAGKKDSEGLAPSALITVNGRNVVKPQDFSNTNYIKKEISLAEENTINVELRGRPGSGVRVIITGRNDEPQVVDFSKLIIPDGRELLGLDLQYLWSVVKQPEGGQAIFSDPSSAKPSLRVNLPGQYSLLLKISGATWQESFPITLTASAYQPYVPVPVQTRVVSSSSGMLTGIKVGTTTYSTPIGTNCGSSSTHGFQVLVLDRDTLAMKDNVTFHTPCGNQAMLDFLATLGDATRYPVKPLVVVSSLSFAPPSEICGNSSSCPLGGALEDLGGTTVYRSHYSEALSYSVTVPYPYGVYFTYSLIGIPGLGANKGTELNNWDHRAVTASMDKMSPSIKGYFVQDVAAKWTFTYPEYVNVETRAESGATNNTVNIGGFFRSDGSYVPPASYPSEPLATGSAGGFQLVVLDRDTLAAAAPLPTGLQPNMTFSTNGGLNNAASSTEQQRMYNALEALRSDSSRRYLAVIASLGAPINYKDPDTFNKLVKSMANYYGGTVGFLLQLSPTSTYTLVGFSSAAAHPVGAQDAVESTASNQNLRVAMHKDNQGWYKPAITSPVNVGAVLGPDLGILTEAMKPYTPWPLPNPAHVEYQQQLAAYQYISQNVGEGAITDIRSHYVAGDASRWLDFCPLLQWSAVPDSWRAQFSEPVFNAMKDQLCYKEFNYLSIISGFSADLDYAFLKMQTSSYGPLANIYQTVTPLVDVPSQNKVLYNTGIVIRGILTAGTSIVTDAGQKAFMGVLNGVMSIAMGLSKRDTGADYSALETAYSSLETEMNLMWANLPRGKEKLVGMIKSDWGKLSHVADKLITPESAGGWQYLPEERQDWVDQVTNTLGVYYFQSLMPAAWHIDYLTDTAITPPKTYGYWTDYCGSYGCFCQPYCREWSSSLGLPSPVYHQDVVSGFGNDWYILTDTYEQIVAGCPYVQFSHSTNLRSVLFGSGDWAGGKMLSLDPILFYERWLPASMYRKALHSNYEIVHGESCRN